MENLEVLRLKIDAIDAELVRLLDDRLAVVQKVAQYKQANNLPVYQPDREAALLAKVRTLSANPDAAAALFKALLEISKQTQRSLENEK